MSDIVLNRKSCGGLLAQYSELVQKAGGFPRFADAALVRKACKYWDPKEKKKPTFSEENGDPEIYSLNILLAAVHKGQQLNPCPYNLTDADLINDIIEYLVKEGADNVDASKPAEGESKGESSKAAKPKDGKAAKAAVMSARQSQKFEEESDDASDEREVAQGSGSKVEELESDEDLKPATRKSKGKAKE